MIPTSFTLANRNFNKNLCCNCSKWRSIKLHTYFYEQTESRNTKPHTLSRAFLGIKCDTYETNNNDNNRRRHEALQSFISRGWCGLGTHIIRARLSSTLLPVTRPHLSSSVPKSRELIVVLPRGKNLRYSISNQRKTVSYVVQSRVAKLRLLNFEQRGVDGFDTLQWKITKPSWKTWRSC